MTDLEYYSERCQKWHAYYCIVLRQYGWSNPARWLDDIEDELHGSASDIYSWYCGLYADVKTVQTYKHKRKALEKLARDRAARIARQYSKYEKIRQYVSTL